MLAKCLAIGSAVLIAAGIGSGRAADSCCAVEPDPATVTLPPNTPLPMITPISPFGGPAMMPLVVPVPIPVLPVAGPPPVTLPTARGVYTVQKGARLWVVAQRTKTRFADLILLNPHLDIAGKLPAGTRVLLPIAGSW